MANEQPKKPQNNSDKSKENVPPPKQNLNKTQADINDTESKSKKSEEKNNESNNRWKIRIVKDISANDLMGHLVNVALIVLTVATFMQTQDSVDVTVKAYVDQKIKDSIADSKEMIKDSLQVIKDKEEDSIQEIRIVHNDSISRENLRLASRSLDAQISSIRETQNQFNATNRPLLQIGNMRFDSLDNYIIPTTIKNFGKQPAEIINVKNNLVISNAPNLKTIPYAASTDYYYFLPQDGSLELTFTFDKKLTEEDNRMLHEGKLYIYMTGAFLYINTANMKKEIYRFLYKISFKPSVDVRKITDEYIELK